ncbi:MAG: acyl carrier protein [Acidobacteriota bacterium]
MTTPNAEAILADITKVAQEHLQWKGALQPEMRLVEDLGLDSLRLLTLAVEIENRFRILLDDGDEAGIETVSDLIAIVQRKLASP